MENIENVNQLLAIQVQVKHKRVEFRAAQVEIEALKDAAIKLLPFKVGDVVQVKSNYNNGFWRIEKITLDDKFFDSKNRLQRSLYCSFIKKDGKIGKGARWLREYDDLDFLGDYNKWLESRKKGK